MEKSSVGFSLPSFSLTLLSLICLKLSSRITYQQLGALLQVLSNACVGRRECAFSVEAMPAKSKKKSKNRVLEEGIAHAPSAVTRAKDKKNNEDVALALAQSQLDQIKLNEAKELDQKILDMAMRRSLSNVPETPRAYITVGGITHVSSAVYVAPNPELVVFPPPLCQCFLFLASRVSLSFLVLPTPKRNYHSWFYQLCSKDERFFSNKRLNVPLFDRLLNVCNQTVRF